VATQRVTRRSCAPPSVPRRPKNSLSLALAVIVLTAVADEPAAGPQPVRTIFERHDQSGVPGKEIVIGSAMLPAGTTMSYHTHPGDESGYVLKGMLILHRRGQPDKILHAGSKARSVTL
jgi:quercetin dioxygenase-like cupin family protein